MSVSKYSSVTAPDGGGLPHSATCTITHSWQNHGWLIRLSKRREHKAAIYFISNFMLEFVFLSSVKTRLKKLQWWKCEKQRGRKGPTFNQQRPRAAGCSKGVSGQTRVPACVRRRDVGDAQRPVVRDYPSDERGNKAARLSMQSDDKHPIRSRFLARGAVSFLVWRPPPLHFFNEGFRIYSRSPSTRLRREQLAQAAAEMHILKWTHCERICISLQFNLWTQYFVVVASSSCVKAAN